MTPSGWTGRSEEAFTPHVKPRQQLQMDGRMKVTTDNTKGEGQTLSTGHVHEEERKH